MQIELSGSGGSDSKNIQKTQPPGDEHCEPSQISQASQGAEEKTMAEAAMLEGFCVGNPDEAQNPPATAAAIVAQVQIRAEQKTGEEIRPSEESSFGPRNVERVIQECEE